MSEPVEQRPVEQRPVEHHPPDDEPIPWQQALTDDVFLLMMAGLVIPTLFYIVWGLLELANVRVFRP